MSGRIRKLLEGAYYAMVCYYFVTSHFNQYLGKEASACQGLPNALRKTVRKKKNLHGILTCTCIFHLNFSSCCLEICQRHTNICWWISFIQLWGNGAICIYMETITLFKLNVTVHALFFKSLFASCCYSLSGDRCQWGLFDLHVTWFCTQLFCSS